MGIQYAPPFRVRRPRVLCIVIRKFSALRSAVLGSAAGSNLIETPASRPARSDRLGVVELTPPLCPASRH